MDDNFRKALEREARLLNSLKHSALPRVSDHFLESDGQFLVMEFVTGDDLISTLESRGEPFSYETVLDWADQLLDALDYLHGQEHPVIHRDIKPQNLKLTPKGQIILLDFGLAKGNPTDAAHHTAAKSIFGYSRNYASLEQIQGTGTDPRSDLYSLAATLYHLMTGIAPEDALTRAMAVLSQQADPLLPANEVRREIPAGVAAILKRAMDLNAALRPGSAAEMRAMFRDHHRFGHETNLSAPAIPRPTDAKILAQPTSARAEVTNAAVRAEAVTELMPDFRSQVTSVRDARSTGEPVRTVYASDTAATEKPKRRLIYAFAGILSVFAVCAGAFGLWIYDQEAVDAAPPEASQPAAIVESPSQDSADVLSEQSAEVEEPQVSSEGQSRRQDSASTQSKPAQRRNQEPEASREVDNPDEKIVIDGDSIDAGNVKIRKGRVITPNVNIVVPEPPNMMRRDMPIDERRLTPEQRRKLQMLRRRNPNAFPRPSPKN